MLFPLFPFPVLQSTFLWMPLCVNVLWLLGQNAKLSSCQAMLQRCWIEKEAQENFEFFELADIWRHKCSRTYSFFVVYNCQQFEECLGFSMQTLYVCMPGVSVLTADLEIVGKKCWIRLMMWRWLTDNGSQNNCVKTARNIKRIWWVLRFLWCLPFTIVLETLGCLIIFLVYLIHLTMK